MKFVTDQAARLIAFVRTNIEAHMWKIDRLATSFLTSAVPREVKTAKITPTIGKNDSSVTVLSTLDAKSSTARIENLSPNTAKDTLPGQLASTCASGNHTEKGKVGVLQQKTRNTSENVSDGAEFWVIEPKHETIKTVDRSDIPDMIKNANNLR